MLVRGYGAWLYLIDAINGRKLDIDIPYQVDQLLLHSSQNRLCQFELSLKYTLHFSINQTQPK